MVILAAIDERKRSEQVVTIAHDLAMAYDDTFIALHVVPIEDYDEHKKSIENISDFPVFSLNQEAGSARAFAREFVMNTIPDIDDDRFEPQGRVGDVADEILEAAATIDPRYLVISGRRRSPTGKAIFGNRAQRILLNAECPVVTKLSDE